MPYFLKMVFCNVVFSDLYVNQSLAGQTLEIIVSVILIVMKNSNADR
jgi:hypothetical protein